MNNTAEVAVGRSRGVKTSVVEIDVESVIAEFSVVVEQAEISVRASRNMKRLGLVLSSAASEISDMKDELGKMGVRSDPYVSAISDLGSRLLKLSEWDTEESNTQAMMLRLLMAHAKRLSSTVKMQGVSLLKRWDDLGKLQQEVVVLSEKIDFPFSIKVTRSDADGEMVSGVRTNVTYWHNLRAKVIKQWGPFDKETNKHWQDAKKRLHDEGVVEVGVWKFERL